MNYQNGFHLVFDMTDYLPGDASLFGWLTRQRPDLSLNQIIASYHLQIINFGDATMHIASRQEGVDAFLNDALSLVQRGMVVVFGHQHV